MAMSLYCVKRLFMAHSLMTERSPQDQDKYVVRFPDGLRDHLKRQAEKNGRSLNAEIIKRLQDTVDWEARFDGAGTPDSLDDYGVSFDEHREATPSPGAAIKGALDRIFDEVRSLRMSIIDVRHHPDGRREVEFAPSTRSDDDVPLPDPPPFPNPKDLGYDEALLKQIETIANRYGLDLVKRDPDWDWRKVDAMKLPKIDKQKPTSKKKA